MLGIAPTIVIPPASAAAVPVEKSSLCVAPGPLVSNTINQIEYSPGSLRCTWTSIIPGSTIVL